MREQAHQHEGDAIAHPLLRLTGVSKSYRGSSGETTVLRNVDFAAAGGEVVWLRGPSGSGKSSLLRIAGLLSSPDSGVVEVMGAVSPQLKYAHMIRRRHIGMVFQNGNLLPHLSVRDNIALASVRADVVQVGRLLETFGLIDLSDRLAKEISGGQAQRVAVCRALLNDPDLILADEPTAGLDAAQGGTVLGALSASRRRGRSLVIASHDERTAEVADRLVTIERGRIV